jgi:hypothetical protein
MRDRLYRRGQVERGKAWGYPGNQVTHFSGSRQTLIIPLPRQKMPPNRVVRLKQFSENLKDNNMPATANRITRAIKLLEEEQVERDKAYRKTRDAKEAEAITTLSKALEHLDSLVE